MSRMKVLAVLTLVLAVSMAYGQQQTVQPGQPQQGAQRGMGGSTPAWNSPQAVQNLSQAVDQASADLQKSIDTANSQAKGRVIGAAFTLHGQGTGSPSAQSTTGQGQNLVAHVYVIADNQIKDVIVDAKNDKVLNVDTRQMVSNPWTYREGGMGTGGSSGAQGSSQGRSGGNLRERAGMPADVSLLRLDTAQKIVKYADQDNITLQRVVDFANSQVKGGKIFGAFLVLPQHANLGAAGQQSTSGQQETVYGKVYALVDNQVKVMTIDAKNNKVLSTETRSTFIGPWEGRMGGGMGTGGSQGQQPGSTPDQPGTSGQESGGSSWPTGSSEGTGPGSLGG